MSKENVLELFAKASANEQIKNGLGSAASFTELVELGKKQGLDFSVDQVKEVIADVATKKSGFFGFIAEAVLELFGPVHDDYPATGVQPFTGEPNQD